VTRALAAAIGVGLGLGLVLVPAARAEDGIRPRTPVVWRSDTPCMLTVDRSVDPIVNLPYAIALEDPPEGESISDDEVADGRRHQFLAFRTDIDPRIAMPQWISHTDVMAASLLGLVDPASVDDDEVLDTHPVLGTELVRIDADDARRPITFAAADAGVDWDTSAFAAGTWVVRAYTWDPWPSRWALPRRGAVRIIDDAASPMVSPALAVAMDPPILHKDAIGTIEGCIVADEGTVLSAAWALATDPAAELVEFASDIPMDGDTIAIDFAPPEALWGTFAVLRVSAIDPDGRRYDAFVADRITVLATESGGESSSSGDPSSGGSSADTTSVADTGGATSNDATTSGGTTTTSGGSEATTAEQSSQSSSGCGCASTVPRATPHLLLFLGLLPRRRRT
jgi:hypothetical protein